METETLISRPIISKQELLDHWQGHRKLTRRVIELFPEKELFNFNIGNMRPFSEMAIELLSIAAPGLKEIVNNESRAFKEDTENIKTKEDILALWDKSTVEINNYWEQITAERFHEMHNLFGEYKFPIIQNIFYFIDNEIHHRAQAYVYLRALNIEPPFFWER